MNRISTTIVAAAAVALFPLDGCSKRDRVVTVEANDPEMVVATARARETLPEFWKAFEKRDRGESDFALKVKITDNRGTEHFWVTGIEQRDGKTMGTVNNDPNIVASVKMGDRVEIREADISDWLFMRDGKMVGNETLRPLLKRMPAADAEKLKNMMVSP